MRAPSRAALVTTSKRWNRKPKSTMPMMMNNRSGRTSANSMSSAPRSDRRRRRVDSLKP